MILKNIECIGVKVKRPYQWTLIRKSPAQVSFGILAQNNATLADGAYYSIKLEAEDLSGNISTDKVAFRVDSHTPVAPVLLSAVLNVADVDVTWQASAETDLAGYLLYRNDQLVNFHGQLPDSIKAYLISGTTYKDKSIPDGAFSYQLYAVDSAGNISPPSNIVTLQINAHTPHMTITADKSSFEDYVTITAQSADLDIAQVQFQYKKTTSTSWTDLGSPLTSASWEKRFDPNSLGLPYSSYDIRALATDKTGLSDSSPMTLTVSYQDLTKPVPPAEPAAGVNGGDVTLEWQPNTETDVQGYNIYQLVNSSKNKLNGSIISTTSFVITGLADGDYSYAVYCRGSIRE